jgi:hypothetical protein
MFSSTPAAGELSGVRRVERLFASTPPPEHPTAETTQQVVRVVPVSFFANVPPLSLLFACLFHAIRCLHRRLYSPLERPGMPSSMPSQAGWKLQKRAISGKPVVLGMNECFVETKFLCWEV